MTWKRDKKSDWVLGYYRALQVVHWGVLVGVIFFGFDGYKVVSSGLVGKARQLMSISTYLDFFVSAPTAVLGGRKWLKVSLASALISSLIYLGVLLGFGIWEWSAGNIIILIVFAPIALVVKYLW